MTLRTWTIFAFAAFAMAGTLGLVHAQGGMWGDIKGQIIWGGPNLPVAGPLPIPVGAGGGCPKVVMDETYVVNPKNKGLRDVFIWLEPAAKGGNLPIHPNLKQAVKKKFMMDQPGCAFIPRVVALREGDILVAKNGSAIPHNFRWTGNPIVNEGGNVLLPPGASKEINDLKADRTPVSIECSIHPWMRGYVRVFDHPYFATTDADGNFTIKDAPAGNFRMKVWHAADGWLGGKEGRNGQPIAINVGQNNVGALPYP